MSTHEHDDRPNAFVDFIEHELPLGRYGDDADNFSMVPQAVVDAAWQRFLQRLAQQTQALAADPQLDLWEEALSDEHRAIVDAVERAFAPRAKQYALSGTDATEWSYWLHCIAVLTLHVEEDRPRVLEPADIMPYLDVTPYDESFEEDSPTDSPNSLTAWLATHRVDPATVCRRSGRFGWEDLALVFMLSGVFWLVVSELIARAGL